METEKPDSSQPDTSKPDSSKLEPAKPRTVMQKIRRGIGRFFLAFFLVIVLYFLIVLVGLIPVNNDFKPTPNGIPIYLTSTAVHADVIVPVENDIVDWREFLKNEDFKADLDDAKMLAIGWGDKGFYIGTPTWNDLKVSTVLQALFWPSDSCMHVGMWRKSEPPKDAQKVMISKEQYRKLADYIKKSFKQDEDNNFLVIKDAAYGKTDAFYEANGTYHGLNTCNCWAGQTIRAGGVRAGWLTPLPKSMFLYLPE